MNKGKGKKGMTIGMVFVFIVAAITFALIMIFGYKTIADFMGKGEEVEFYRFKTDLETSIKQIYSDYGSVRIEEFNLPMKYKHICFVNLDAPYPEDCDFDAYACDVWKDAGSYEKGEENVFLEPIAPVGIKVYKISMEGNYLCLNISKGTFKLRLEGKGDRTYLALAR